MRKRGIIAGLIAVAMLFVFTSCGKKEGGNADDWTMDGQLNYVEGEADKAGSMWELICRLFPDYVIFKDDKGGFTFEPVNKELALDTYDWSSLAGTYKGIDVSHYQGKIDWEKVAGQGIEFAFIRVGYRGYGEGKLVTDKYYQDNIEGALKNDVNVGAYFVTKALTEAEAVEEAEYLIDCIKPYNITWPVVIDIEPTKTNTADRTFSLMPYQRTSNVIAFCDTIREAGYTPMIYGGVGTFMKYLEFERLEGIEKWFAQYFNQPWLRYEFGIWQAKDDGYVDGIKGNVDIDYSIKNYKDLNSK